MNETVMDAPLLPPTSPPQPSAVQHFVGFVETTTDALRLIMAARQGVIPRITRRLNDSERRSMIRSGAVFVFCVEESGIKRWTEGLSWSPSRIIGNFLVYREVTERGNSRALDRRTSAVGTSPGLPLSPSSSAQRYRSRSEAGPGRSGDSIACLRQNGLIKKTITVKVEGTDHHLISYYRDEDVRSGLLQRPTQRRDIMALSIPPEMVRATNFRHPPHIEIGPDGSAHIYDAEEADYQRRQHTRASSVSTSSSSHSPTSPTGQSISMGDISQPEMHSPVSVSPPLSLYDHQNTLADNGYGHPARSPATAQQGSRWPGSLPPLSVHSSRQDLPPVDDRAFSRDVRSSVAWQRPYEAQQPASPYANDGMYNPVPHGRDGARSDDARRPSAVQTWSAQASATMLQAGHGSSGQYPVQRRAPERYVASPVPSTWNAGHSQLSDLSYHGHRPVPRHSEDYYSPSAY